MTYFDSQNGWIQIAFANEEDSYVLPSMISVGYQRYLFYCLKKAGYEAVYFWGDGESNLEIFYMDRDSAQYYEKIRPQGLFDKFFGTVESGISKTDNQLESVKIVNETVMEQLFYNIVKSKKKTALVAPMKVFDEFFSKNGRSNTLIEKYKEQKSNKNLILITASIRAEDSNRYLTKKDGVLYKLFEELRQALMATKSDHIYQALQRNMGEKCCYLNDLNRGMIRNVVRRRLLLDTQNGDSVSNDLIEMLTLVYEWYYHSQKFRENTPISLPENKKRELKVIDKSLQNMRTMGTISAWVEDSGEWRNPESFHAYLKSMYPKDTENCFIYTDNFLLRLWEQMVIPEGMLNAYQKSLKRKMTELTDRLRAVILRNDEDLDKVNLDICMEQMKKSIKNYDADSLRHAINSAEYLLDNCYERESTYQEVWPFYQKLFELSNEINKLKIEVKDNKQRITALFAKFNQLDEQYLQSKEMPGVTEAELEVMVKKIIQCDEEKTMLENVNVLKENQIHQYESVIETIEQAIQSARWDGIANVQNVYEQAITMQKKMLDQSFQTISDIEKTKEKFPDFVEHKEEKGGSSLEELEDQYRVLAARMKQIV